MAWHLSPALVVLRDEINRRWPNRDKASDGSIGDASHAAGTSDHNPDANESVNAIDIDEDVTKIGVTGKSAEIYKILEAFEKHPSAHYWIYERQIADKDDGWRRRPYTGSNPHDKHAHMSIRHGNSYENDTRSWGLLEGDIDMDKNEVFDAVWKNDRLPNPYSDKATNPTIWASTFVTNIVNELASIKATVAKIAATPPGTVTVTDEQLERVLRKVIGSVDAA